MLTARTAGNLSRATARAGRRTGKDRILLPHARAAADDQCLRPEENAEHNLGIGWYRANWMPDNKSAVANGLIGRERVMVRLSLTFPRKVIEQSTDYEAPFSPSISWDGKEIIFIARRPGARTPR